MSNNWITHEMLADAGGLTFRKEEPRALNPALCKEIGTWPEGMPVPDVIVFYGTTVYEKDAHTLAAELGTTPRQISKLRSGRIEKAKPLSWYEENRKGDEYGGGNPKHLPTGI